MKPPSANSESVDGLTMEHDNFLYGQQMMAGLSFAKIDDRIVTGERENKCVVTQNEHGESKEVGHENNVDNSVASSCATATMNLSDELRFIKANLLFLNHQMSMLMQSLNVDTCSCVHCNTIGLTKCSKQTNNSSEIMHKRNDQSINNEDRSLINNDIKEFAKKRPKNKSNVVESLRYFAPKRGRKSKYCSPIQKKAVAGYAHMHGASAAARKFNIPPAVAAYYYRKEFKSPKMSSNDNSNVFFPSKLLTNNNKMDNEHSSTESLNGKASAPFETLTSNYVSDENVSTSLTTSSNGLSMHPSVNVFNSDSSIKNEEAASSKSSNISLSKSTTPTGNLELHNYENATTNDFDSNDPLWSSIDKNTTHSGSPGFLRGRGRGRPKLIGDELDAELVEYMVQLKATNRRQHLTAAQALHIARAYISEKAPGLLEEHGGQIKLKITWAMKLVSRVQEREREIQLGLPAGSLQNFGKTNLTSLPNGLVNELMVQNFFGQQNLKVSDSAVKPGTPTSLSSININETSLTNICSASKSISSTLLQVQQQQQRLTAMEMNMPLTESKPLDIITKNDNAENAAATLACLFSKLPAAKQFSPNLGMSTELYDPTPLLSELGANSIEELTQNELLKSLLQSLQHNENDLTVAMQNNNTQQQILNAAAAVIATTDKRNINDAITTMIDSSTTSTQSNNNESKIDFLMTSAF